MPSKRKNRWSSAYHNKVFIAHPSIGENDTDERDTRDIPIVGDQTPDNALRLIRKDSTKTRLKRSGSKILSMLRNVGRRSGTNSVAVKV
jgi:hypothetical protein